MRILTPVGVTLIGFANDLAVVATAKDVDTLRRKLNATHDRLVNWMNNNYLAIAPEKSEAAIFSERRMVASC